MTTQATFYPEYQYDNITVAQYGRLPEGTVSQSDHAYGMRQGEPLIIALDAMIKYAQAHKIRFDSPLSDDYVLGPEWLEVVKGLRGLLNGNGAVAYLAGRGTDSKDNGACEAMFWAALEIAGFSEEDI